MIAFLYIPHYFWHPLNGNGYQFWSGIAGSFLTSLPPWIIALAIFYYHHNCHVKGCPRIGHLDPENHHPACRHHHSHAQLLGAPALPTPDPITSSGGDHT